MLKELFESQFYRIFPKVQNRVLNLNELVRTGMFSLLDKEACRYCRYVCDIDAAKREQMKVVSSHPVSIIRMEDVFGYVQESIGETCDYMMEGNDLVAVVEMTCSTADYVIEKRRKVRRQLYNTLACLMASPVVKSHIERLGSHYAVFSWRETFGRSVALDSVSEGMAGMMVMADEVYSPDNESSFAFGFKLKEIRYPSVFVI